MGMLVVSSVVSQRINIIVGVRRRTEVNKGDDSNSNNEEEQIELQLQQQEQKDEEAGVDHSSKDHKNTNSPNNTIKDNTNSPKSSKEREAKKSVCRRIMNFWRMVAAAYILSLEKRPVMTEMATSGCIWCLGDLAAQRIERFLHFRSLQNQLDAHPSPSSSSIILDTPATTTMTTTAGHHGHHNKGGIISNRIDWKQTFHQTAYASFLWGPFAHHWYHRLDHVVLKFVTANTNPQKKQYASLITTGTKLFLEMIWLHPVSLSAYFVVMGKMKGDSFRTIGHQLKQDFWPTFIFEIALWLPIDVCNFAFVPVAHQLFFANCGCFLESIGLSLIAHNGMESILSQAFSFWSSTSTTTTPSSKEEAAATSAAAVLPEEISPLLTSVITLDENQETTASF